MAQESKIKLDQNDNVQVPPTPSTTTLSDERNKLFEALFNFNNISADKNTPIWNQIRTDLEQKGCFKSIDKNQLREMLKFVHSKTFIASTEFLSGKNGVFQKCRLPPIGVNHYPMALERLKTTKQQQLQKRPLKPIESSSDLKVKEETMNTTTKPIADIRRLITMADDEELMALDRLRNDIGHTFCTNEYGNLTSANIDKLMEQLVLIDTQKSGWKMFRLARRLRSKSEQRWDRLKHRFTIYRQYFINRLFNSANCIITCWLFCFCASLFN